MPATDRALDPHGSRRATLRRLVPAVAAIAVAVAVLAVLSSRTDRSPEIPPIEGASPLTWEAGSVSSSRQRSSMNDVAAIRAPFTDDGSNFIAVGWEADAESDLQLAAMWSSEDGSTWNEVPLDPAVFDGAWLELVSPTPTGVVIAGTHDGRPAVWISPDRGANWERTILAGSLGEVTDIAYFNGRLRAFGQIDWRPTVWRSVDGVAWRLDELVGAPDGRVTAAAVAGGDEHIAFVKPLGDHDESTPVVLRFQGDQLWSAVGPMPADADWVHDALWLQGRYVASGAERTGGADPSPMIWTSEDGSDWTRAEEVEGFGPVYDLATVDGSILALGAGVAWISDDFRRWRTDQVSWRTVDIGSAPGDAWHRAAPVGGSGFVVVGGSGGEARTWVGSMLGFVDDTAVLRVRDEPGVTPRLLESGRPVFVVVDDAGVVVVDAVSTHLDHDWVAWCPTSGTFRETHGGMWDRAGGYVGGPPRTNLGRYAIDVDRVDGELYIEIIGYDEPHTRSSLTQARLGAFCAEEELELHPFYGVG